MAANSWDERTREAILKLAEAEGFIVSESGRIRWTARGVEKMGRRFAQIGVDIRRLSSLERYVDARTWLSNEFEHELRAIADRGPRTLERELLVAILDDDEALSKQLEIQLDHHGKDSSSS